MSTAASYSGPALAPSFVPSSTSAIPRTAPRQLGAWHSQVALGVYGIALSLMDGLHMALREPAVRPPVIWLHLILGLAVYPVFIAVAVTLTHRLRLDGDRRMRNAALHLLVGLLLQYVHYLMLHWILANVIWPLFYPGSVLSSRVILGISANHYREYPIDLLAYWVVIGFVHASEYYYALGERQIAAAKLEATLAEARLEVLRRQLSPHFLFNTLNTISVLALRGDKNAVVDTLSRLSDLLRIAIDEDHPQLVTLSEELNFLEGYLGIQQVRFGDRLKVSLKVDPDSLRGLVPFMILQPIVENAIEHGISAKAGGSTVSIQTSIDTSTLRLTVHDSGPGFSPAERQRASRRHGIGLANTTQRLQQLYGDQHSIRRGDSPNGGALVEISVPFQSHAQHA